MGHKALGRKSGAELLAELEQARRDNGETGFFAFTIWVDGQMVKAGAFEGSMVTIQRGNRVFGLYPQKAAKGSKHVPVSLLELKSDRQAPTKGKVLQSVKASATKRLGFNDADIHIQVASVRMAKPKNLTGKCCVQITPKTKVCASCYVKHGNKSCCVGFFCCLLLAIEFGREILT